MLSNHEKIKFERGVQNGKSRLKEIQGYEGIAPCWMTEAARNYISQQITMRREAIETGDEFYLALSDCEAFDDADHLLHSILDEWGITDIKEWISCLRRDMRRSEKTGNWKRVAVCALRIEEYEAAIAELRKRRAEKRGEIAA